MKLGSGGFFKCYHKALLNMVFKYSTEEGLDSFGWVSVDKQSQA